MKKYPPFLVRSIASLALTALTTLASSGCGGGGGGGGGGSSSYEGAASVGLSVRPSNIDTGDRALVEASLGDVIASGIAVKFRYPLGLDYVKSSAALIVEDKTTKIAPTVHIDSDREEATYLVFYLSQKLFRRPGETYNGDPGTLRFELVGKGTVNDGLVEVDPDVDDPAVKNSEEFSLQNPEFSAEDQAPISVAVAR